MEIKAPQDKVERIMSQKPASQVERIMAQKPTQDKIASIMASKPQPKQLEKPSSSKTEKIMHQSPNRGHGHITIESQNVIDESSGNLPQVPPKPRYSLPSDDRFAERRAIGDRQS